MSLNITAIDVCLDGLIDRIHAFEDNSIHWNGFVCPYFRKEDADAIMDIFNSEPKCGATISFDESSDAYVITNFEEYGGDVERIDGMDIMFEGEEIHVYPMGSWNWCWTSAD